MPVLCHLHLKELLLIFMWYILSFRVFLGLFCFFFSVKSLAETVLWSLKCKKSTSEWIRGKQNQFWAAITSFWKAHCACATYVHCFEQNFISAVSRFRGDGDARCTWWVTSFERLEGKFSKHFIYIQLCVQP